MKPTPHDLATFYGLTLRQWDDLSDKTRARMATVHATHAAMLLALRQSLAALRTLPSEATRGTRTQAHIRVRAKRELRALITKAEAPPG